ncbi:MAG: hypothetical protein M5U26_04800 [Planctomycetota bacterium]|nr:hypothetical protein [Planctomycetota bacterium]
MRTWVWILALLGSCACAAEGLVSEAPEPRPALPPGVEAYAPPARPVTAGERIGISEITRTGGPSESLAIAGYGFDAQTQFIVFGQHGGAKHEGAAAVRSIDAFRAVVTLPAELPAESLYLVWPVNGAACGAPAAVNRAELWYTLPCLAAPGETIGVYGRNLAKGPDAPAWVYLRKRGETGPGRLLAAASSNPYRVEVALPDDLPLGEYEVYLHNGLGGELGWASLHALHGGATANSHLTVEAPKAWSGPTFNVRDFGAKGDGRTDDTAAALAALAKANATARATLHFPAGSYLLSEPLATVSGPDKTGMRITGEGMSKTFIKGNPAKLPKQLLIMEGNDIELRDLALDINYLGEAEKFYRDAKRPAYDPERDLELQRKREQLDAEKAAARKAEQERAAKLKAWQRDKANQGKPVPPELQPPPKPELAPKQEKPPEPGFVLQAKGYHSGTRLINCVIDAERWRCSFQGLANARIENCDIVAKEFLIGCPKHTLIDRCHFFARADAPVMLYAFGGWCNAITRCTGRDYMPGTYDTAMGRFYTVSAYGNRCENTYLAENETFDLTVQPMHFNQNSGEQIMWEFIDPISTQAPKAADAQSVTFAEAFKNEKIDWYATAAVVAGKGLGQYRQVEKYDPASGRISLRRPWAVAPDEKSSVTICRSVNRQVVYRNRLDGKPRAYRSESHIASAGVEPFGISFDLVVDGNTFHEIRSGLAICGPAQHHLYQNNVFQTGRWGIQRLSAGPDTFGVVARRNRFDGMLETGVAFWGNGPAGASCVIENNDFVNLPVGVQVGTAKSTSDNQQILVHRNRFSLGAAPAKEATVIRAQAQDLVLDVENIAKDYPSTWSAFPGK